MGKTQQAAGGGKATVEGLSAGVVLNGKTVTIKQGSKIIEQVTGSGKLNIVNVGTFTNGVSKVLPGSIPNNIVLTKDNFLIGGVSTSTSWNAGTARGFGHTTNASWSYDSSTRTLTVNGLYSNYVPSNSIAVSTSVTVIMYCVYVS